MIQYSETVKHDLIALAKYEINDLKAGRSDYPAPLKPQNVAAKRLKNLKGKPNAMEIIEDLERQGRNLEVRWQSSTVRDKCYEVE